MKEEGSAAGERPEIKGTEALRLPPNGPPDMAQKCTGSPLEEWPDCSPPVSIVSWTFRFHIPDNADYRFREAQT